ncbi:MAG: GAF domain-containing protein [Deltaproteobacteria bacterium]|nr:GAF domain-containing protein [Deltaproteobacteria bacterium]
MIPLPSNLVQAILAIHLAMEMKELYAAFGEYLHRLFAIRHFSCFLFNNDNHCYSLDYSTIIPPAYWDEMVFHVDEAPFRVLFGQEPSPFPLPLQWFNEPFPMHWSRKLTYQMETAAAVVFHEYPENLDENLMSLGFLLNHFTTALIRTTIYCEMRSGREKQAARLDLINEMGNMVGSSGLDPLLAALMGMALRISGAEVGSIMLYDDQEKLETRIEWGLKDDCIRSLGLKGEKPQPYADTICAGGKPFLIKDVSTDTSLIQSDKQYRITSIAAFPLQTQHRVYGLLNLVNLNPAAQGFNQDIETLGTITRLAATTIENYSLQKQLQQAAGA